MKHYKFYPDANYEHVGNLFEDSRGNLVEYELWMDGARCIKVEEQPREPTICVRCKHCESGNIEVCSIERLNFVDGKHYKKWCHHINVDGNCLDYESKE